MEIKKKRSDVLAPLGCYEKAFVKEVFRAYYMELTTYQIAVYMGISINEVDHIIDLYLPIIEAMGSLEYVGEDVENTNHGNNAL